MGDDNKIPEVRLALLEHRLGKIEEDIKGLPEKFASIKEFLIVRNLVFTGVGSVLLSVLGGLLALVKSLPS
jgi:hypothetical protein